MEKRIDEYLKLNPEKRYMEKELKEAAKYKNRELVTEFLDAEDRKGRYIRIYPAVNSERFQQFIEPRPVDKLIYDSLFNTELIDQQK